MPLGAWGALSRPPHPKNLDRPSRSFLRTGAAHASVSVLRVDLSHDELAHLPRPDHLLAFPTYIRRAVALLEDPQDGRIHAIGILGTIERVPQQHPGGQDRRDRV